MDEQPPKVLRHYTIEPSEGPPHQHAYEYVGGGEHVVRHCECGKSWVLHEVNVHGLVYTWKETKEWDEV